MLNEINYRKLNEDEKEIVYGKGADLGMSIITAFGIVAIITVIVYKIFGSKTGDVTLPGGFKIRFTT